MADKRQPFSGVLYCYVSNCVALGCQKQRVKSNTSTKLVSVSVDHFVRCTFIPVGFDKSWIRPASCHYTLGSFLESNFFL